jgi:hypothetical protein
LIGGNLVQHICAVETNEANMRGYLCFECPVWKAIQDDFVRRQRLLQLEPNQRFVNALVSGIFALHSTKQPKFLVFEIKIEFEDAGKESRGEKLIELAIPVGLFKNFTTEAFGAWAMGVQTQRNTKAVMSDLETLEVLTKRYPVHAQSILDKKS